jgi:hypothetical protein
MNCGKKFLFFIILFFGWGALAQSQRALIINDGALVYQDADFDAAIMGELKAGKVYVVSLKQKGPFYKIRVKPGLTGWIADNDIRLSKDKSKNPVAGVAKKPGKVAAAKNDKLEPLEKPKKPFYATRFRGPTVDYLTYNENTMGGTGKQNLPFFGFKVNGPNTMFSGDLRTDAEFLFHFGAPSYYEKATGNAANGWIFLADFIFETALPQSKWHMLTFGFGPMFKYSHLEVGLQENSKTIAYSLDDMSIGAVFDGGIAFRVGSYALRFNTKYYWEKTQYWGFGATFGFPF